MGSRGKTTTPRNVIDLLDSSDDEKDAAPAPASAKKQKRAPVPKLDAASPPSTSTANSSRNALASLLAGNGKPPLPPRRLASRSTKAAATKPAALKRRTTAATETHAGVGVSGGGGIGEDTGAARQRTSQQQPIETQDLWTVKHDPMCLEDLVVHKKKVEEVRAWLQRHQTTDEFGAPLLHGGKMLVISGPPGCGKTTTLRLVTESLGFHIVEWQAQAQISWEEVQYQGPGGVQYQSKLDAFEEFAARAKMAALPLGVVHSVANNTTTHQPAGSEDGPQSSAAGGEGGGGASHLMSNPPSRPTLIIIDDLPYTSGHDQRKQLARALSDLARCARFPVVLIATEASGRAQQERGHMAAAVSGASGLHKDIIEALSSAGATTISFNAITALNTSKALHRVLEKEGREMGDAAVATIAQQAEGDLRNALCTLQFACTGIAQQAQVPPPPKRRKGKASGGKSVAKETAAASDDVQRVAYMMRDTSLSVFHGLGKLLYNKRLPPDDQAQEEVRTESDSVVVQQTVQSAAWACRAPMDGFCPERVIETSGLEPGSVAAFLHENIHNFIEDSAIDDIAACMSQLSAADVLESGSRRLNGGARDGSIENSNGGSITASAAASVAARGICFYNAHPAPRRWLPLQAPALYTVQRGVAANGEQLERAAGAGRVKHGKSGGLDGKVAVAAELMPYLRLIAPPTAHGAHPSDLIMQQPAKWSRFWKGKMYETVAHAGVAPGDEDDDLDGGGGARRAAEIIEDFGDDW